MKLRNKSRAPVFIPCSTAFTFLLDLSGALFINFTRSFPQLVDVAGILLSGPNRLYFGSQQPWFPLFYRFFYHKTKRFLSYFPVSHTLFACGRIILADDAYDISTSLPTTTSPNYPIVIPTCSNANNLFISLQRPLSIDPDLVLFQSARLYQTSPHLLSNQPQVIHPSRL